MNLTQIIQRITATFLMLGLGCTLAIGDDATNINLSGSASKIAASGFVGLQNNLRSDQPVHLLLPDAEKTEQGVFIITNSASDPAYLHLKAYDASGALLVMDYLHLDGKASRRVAWTDLPSDSASVVVMLDNPEEGLHVHVPRGSSVVLADSATRDLLLPTTIEQTGLLLYNPSDHTVIVNLQGATTETEILWPQELRAVRPSFNETGVTRLTAEKNVAVMSASLTDQYLMFIEPVTPQLVSAICEIKQICAGNATNLHVGRDYWAIPDSYNSSTPTVSVNFGKLRGVVRYDQNVGCSSLSCKMGNVVVLEHLLTDGERWLSLSAHLASNSLYETTVGTPIARNQLIGIVGCSGESIEGFCRPDGSNRHNHFELKKPDLGYSDLWPFGYMNQEEANTLRISGDPTNLPITTAIDRTFSTIPALRAQNAKVLLPYFSRTSTDPSVTNYDVYGTAGLVLHSALPLRPATSKTFTNVGVGGRNYHLTDVKTDSFICATAALTSTSASLSRLSAACNQPISNSVFSEGDYKFFAYSDQFNSGYPVKFAILPPNSEIIDNDGRLVDASGNNTTANRLGYFTSSELNALDVPGYFVTAKLFAAGGSNWARWFPQNGRTYAIWVHVPRGSTATNVRYKVYPRGRPSDGSCSSINTTNPCFMTDAISHLANQDRWVRLVSGTVNRFAFVASSTNGGFVGLEGDWIVGGNAGVDAVKFIGPETFSTCNTITPENFYQPAYNNYGAPFDLFLGNAMSVDAKCSSSDKHTIKATLGIPGNTTRLVYMMGYYYDHSISGWKKYTPTCNGTINGDWCVGSATADITDPNISTDSASAPTYFVGYVCSWQNGQWKCGCRDTACAKNYWQLQGAGR